MAPRTARDRGSWEAFCSAAPPEAEESPRERGCRPFQPEATGLESLNPALPENSPFALTSAVQAYENRWTPGAPPFHEN